MKFLLAVLVLAATNVSAPGAGLGELREVRYEKYGSFSDCVILVRYLDAERAVVTLEYSRGTLSSTRLSKLAEKLRRISSDQPAPTLAGKMIAATDIPIVTIVWRYTKGEYKVVRDMRLTRLDGKFLRVDRIFRKIEDELFKERALAEKQR